MASAHAQRKGHEMREEKLTKDLLYVLPYYPPLLFKMANSHST